MFIHLSRHRLKSLPMIFCGVPIVACRLVARLASSIARIMRKYWSCRNAEYLQKQRLPDSVRGDHFWKGRYEDIASFERYLARNGIAVCKFFLHDPGKEQKRRFMERLNNKDKNWKFSAADLKERKYWDEYQDAYENMIRQTATEHAPWVVVPADNKWFSRLLVVATIVATLDRMNLKYPKVTAAELAELKEARKHLEKE